MVKQNSVSDIDKAVDDQAVAGHREQTAELATDVELLELYLFAADSDALVALVNRLAPLVTAVIRRVVSHPQDAEDAFQATFLILIKSAKSIRSRRSIASWIYGVAYRTACRVRSKSRRQCTANEDWEPVDDPLQNDPIAAIVRQIELSNLDRELQSLPDQLREPLVEHYLLGMTAKQIAERMELSDSAVEGRLRRGRRMLRQRLAVRGLSMSVLAAGAVSMQRSPALAQTSHALAKHFEEVKPWSFQNVIETLEQSDPYLAQLIRGEPAMKIAISTKTTMFAGVMAIATLSLTIIAFANQAGTGVDRTVGERQGRRLQAAVAPDEPASGTDVRLAQPSIGPRTMDVELQRSTLAQASGQTLPEQFAPPKGPQPKWLELGQSEQSQDEELRSRLSDTKIQLDFNQVPLQQVLDSIGLKEKIEFRINDRPDDPEQTITFTTQSAISLSTALELMLEPLDRVYEVRNGLVCIESYDSDGTLRFYNLAHIVDDSDSAIRLMESLRPFIAVSFDEELSLTGSTLIVRCSEADHRTIQRILASKIDK